MLFIISNNYAISQMRSYYVTSKQEGIQTYILEHSNLISELISWQILGRVTLISRNDTKQKNQVALLVYSVLAYQYFVNYSFNSWLLPSQFQELIQNIFQIKHTQSWLLLRKFSMFLIPNFHRNQIQFFIEIKTSKLQNYQFHQNNSKAVSVNPNLQIIEQIVKE